MKKQQIIWFDWDGLEAINWNNKFS